MGRIAVLSDVHGNLPALRAVLEDIEAQGVDGAVCLGDLVDFAPWPNEVVDLVRGMRMPTVMGNHDERIALGYAVTPSAKHTDEENAARVLGVEATRGVITERNRAYLGDLPRSVRMVFGAGREGEAGARCEVLLVHASPRGIDDHVYEDHPMGDLRAMFREAGADVVVMGHTHYPYVRGFAGEDGRSMLAVNCGSVGRLKEKAPGMASYAVLTVDGARVAAEVVRVGYPIEETIEGLRGSGIPEFYRRFFEKRRVLPDGPPARGAVTS